MGDGHDGPSSLVLVVPVVPVILVVDLVVPVVLVVPIVPIGLVVPAVLVVSVVLVVPDGRDMHDVVSLGHPRIRVSIVAQIKVLKHTISTTAHPPPSSCSSHVHRCCRCRSVVLVWSRWWW